LWWWTQRKRLNEPQTNFVSLPIWMFDLSTCLVLLAWQQSCWSDQVQFGRLIYIWATFRIFITFLFSYVSVISSNWSIRRYQSDFHLRPTYIATGTRYWVWCATAPICK
jgi:hypothetical protein